VDALAAAFPIGLLQLASFKAAPNVVPAAVLEGLLTALTPIPIVWGAIVLFKTMEHSGAMDTIRIWLNQVTPHPVGQLMIIPAVRPSPCP
jgi:lactate permease